MSTEDYPHLIATDEPSQKNHFPIVLQLGVLGLVLVAIFGTLLFQNSQQQLANRTLPLPPQPTNGAAAVLVPQKIDEMTLRARAAYVWDVRAQQALYSKNETTALPLASITKLMTALLAYELIEQDDITTISRNAVLQEGSSGLSIGEQLNVQELTELALISSSNDAAYELAASVGSLLGEQDSVAQFVAGMNIKAQDLGLKTLQFRNMTGLDVSFTEPGATGSAQDISFLLEHIIETHPDILTPTQQSAARVYNVNGEYHNAENTNEVLEKIPNLIGSKTGYTDLAGGNLTIAFDLGLNRPIIITVLGSTREERFSDVLKLVAAVQHSITQ